MDEGEVREKVERARVVTITDFSNYCKWKGSNGGQYSFSVTFKRTSENRWMIRYSTSSEFNYCRVFGEFRDCWDCEYFDIETGECRAKPETVTTQEVINKVIRALSDDFSEIDIDDETVKYGEYGCDQCRKGLH
ncbi:MAG: hypothetical protein DRN03_01130 [Thermoplasmata archaeon]|nr:MAG: hypothetical protein DRN03_01130 [Thermoplasmata archaeon]